MKIEGMGNRYAFGLQGERKNRTESEKESSAMQQQDKATGTSEQATAVRGPHHQHHAHGAIRNLQEAHFQGVASLRLQMKFHEQLQENTMQEAGDALATGSDQLVTDLGERVNALGNEFQGMFGETDIIAEMQGLMDTFSHAVNNLFGSSEETDPASESIAAFRHQPGDILAGIQEAFGDFFDAMWQLGQPSTDEPVIDNSATEPTIAAENAESPVTPAVSTLAEDEVTVADINTGEAVDEIMAATAADNPENVPEAPSFTDNLTELQTWFDSQIAALQTSVDDLMKMPPIGQQRGHGVAYNRFLAIYTEMNSTISISQASDDIPQEGGVETEA